MATEEFFRYSHQVHEKSYAEVDIQREIKLYTDWFNNGSVDVWRHLRMMDFLKIVMKSYPNTKWLTLGDGRFGTSASYLQSFGAEVLATDIDLSLLKIATDKAWIKNYKYENAEEISFPDKTFDFTFCKESFHHFPRAYLALYEMIRVSKSAVILVEPNDWLPSPLLRRIIQSFKNQVKRAFNMQIPHPDENNFESIGNYVFTVSKREIQKIASGIGLPCVAFKEFNDVYVKGVEHELVREDGILFRKMKKALNRMSLMNKLGLSGKNHIITILFKSVPTSELITNLKAEGFEFISLPQNPYLKAQ